MTVDADAAPPHAGPPLCVDLDGTLVKSDTLLDALFELLRRNPRALLRAPLWLRGGRAGFKRQVANRAQLDPAHLPYNTELLRFLRAEHIRGRDLYLATGADSELAERVAAHLGLFHGVLASDGQTNLTRERKLDRLRRRFGEFDYVGNSRADLVLLAHAHQAMVANPTLGLRLALRARRIPVAHRFLDRRPVLYSLLQALRLRQWSKNILLFAPLLIARPITPHAVAAAVAAFLCFSFMASAGCLFKALLDIETDRRHPANRLRPFAAGDLAVTTGVVLVAAMVLSSAALLPLLPVPFALWLGLYIVAAPLHSLYLKRLPILDVPLVAGLYMLRLLAGGAATATAIPLGLAVFSALLFLALAMVKRFREL